jgi:hypothetical protein
MIFLDFPDHILHNKKFTNDTLMHQETTMGGTMLLGFEAHCGIFLDIFRKS